MINLSSLCRPIFATDLLLVSSTAPVWTVGTANGGKFGEPTALAAGLGETHEFTGERPDASAFGSQKLRCPVKPKCNGYPIQNRSNYSFWKRLDPFSLRQITNN